MPTSRATLFRPTERCQAQPSSSGPGVPLPPSPSRNRISISRHIVVAVRWSSSSSGTPENSSLIFDALPRPRVVAYAETLAAGTTYLRIVGPCYRAFGAGLALQEGEAPAGESAELCLIRGPTLCPAESAKRT